MKTPRETAAAQRSNINRQRICSMVPAGRTSDGKYHCVLRAVAKAEHFLLMSIETA